LSTSEQIRLQFLVLRTQSGDERAFSQLHKEFGDRTFRYLLGLVGDDVASDIHQEVWLAVYKKISGLANPAAFRTWLYQITRYRALDYLRASKRRNDVLNDLEGGGDAAEIPVEPVEMTLSEQSVLESAVSQLPASQRDAVILRYWEEMSYVEIALVVGCSIGTVRSRLHHAKLKLKTIMEDVADV